MLARLLEVPGVQYVQFLEDLEDYTIVVEIYVPEHTTDTVYQCEQLIYDFKPAGILYRTVWLTKAQLAKRMLVGGPHDR